ncbi:MAG: acetolactate synthase 3 catalytic subunit [Brachymonas sp.]|jgi:acetolactate synthase-1/2/3 large subunit|nr:acetolactate synthase 3 catalytic subunit [Brachymonas sp.]MBP6138046.1 acetolactate synthase 3 catalytic subunit [Brachymonas sp.]MBP6966685.1 acetolactate synthase 3 catalytic subunit [Brachymonas sp.]MBP7246253.1 acetolactate synthase 3 catalytic subunit [Brachymonas sp.]MBP7743691.1 acetolactate synthase 3 catalytic subunit [Brachymonas sp.]
MNTSHTPSAATAPQQSNAPMLMGSELLVKSLEAENVKYIWGYPGGAALYIYDALYKQESIRHLLVRHEQAAVHAADGYARATGDVGVAMVTSGPGATNTITGIATAYMDSIPLVVITAQVPLSLIGQDAFQECDTIGITRPIVKHNFLISSPQEIPSVIKRAFHIARSGRPGPVVIDIPKDVSFQKAAWTGYPKTVEMRSYNPVRKGHSGQIRRALQLLQSAKRPCIYAGGGVLLGNACPELRALVNTLGAPCTLTLMGLGAFPASDPKYLGMLGMHGTVEANNAMQNCDVLLAVGARFDDRVIGNIKHFNQNERKIIHIDIDPSVIAKRVKVDVPIVGDAKDVLTEMLGAINETGSKPDTAALASWWESINKWRKTDCLKYDRDNTSVIKPQKVIETLWNMTKDDDVYITSDVGQHQMWAAQFYRFNEPRRWINSGGLGTMGVGLPYAMGVKMAKPQSEVFCITGEGSIQMNIQELSTCLQHDTPVKICALNNRYLGMVRQWQEIEYSRRYSHSYMDSLPDFVKLAEAYGHVGMLIEDPKDIEPALREARKLKDRTVLMDFRTDSTENVFPMVQAGKGLTEMLLSADAN